MLYHFLDKLLYNLSYYLIETLVLLIPKKASYENGKTKLFLWHIKYSLIFIKFYILMY